MNLKLKVCGMKEPENIRAVASLSPDYMGFIFFRESKRFVGDDFTIPDDWIHSVKRVGVFVNESTNVVLNLVERHGLDLVQLHGTESASQCEEIRRHGLDVIKAFSIDSQFDWSSVDEYAGSIDYSLLDAKGSGYGGTGKTFDWTLLENYKSEIPFFLSGGVSLINFSKAMKIQHERFYAIDVNSGVEIRPGVKDFEKVKNLKELLGSNPKS